MVDHRAETLTALSQFIETQKNLLARTQSDLELLQKLRQDVTDKDNESVDFTVQEKLSLLDVPLSEYQDDSILKQIHWSTFDGHDTTPLHNFTGTLRAQRHSALHPSTRQQSDLSEMQCLVKNARSAMIDPIMATLRELSAGFPETSTTDTATRKQTFHVGSSGHHRHFHRGGLTVSRNPATQCVSQLNGETEGVYSLGEVPMPSGDGHFGPSSPCSSFEIPDPPAPVLTGSRNRRPSARIQESAKSASWSTTASQSSILGSSTKQVRHKKIDSPEKIPSPEEQPPKPSRYLAAPKSGTYKQAWSESEQNLLERLLEEIPHGEKNRWLKISKAMSGRRTPRQVASRVQKYFQKLSQYGLIPTKTET